MSATCCRCGKTVTADSSGKIGRRESCPHCGADLHCCRNCKFYDPKAYNECREPQAERVLDKENSNFCDYFEFGGGSGGRGDQAKKDALKKLDDLFR